MTEIIGIVLHSKVYIQGVYFNEELVGPEFLGL